MKLQSILKRPLAGSIYLGTSFLAHGQLTWDPLPSGGLIWDTVTNEWTADGGMNFVVWDNTGAQEAIFPDFNVNNDPIISPINIADGGVTVGDLTLEVGPDLETITFSSVTDNLGVINVAAGGATWNLGGRELEFSNNQTNDTPLSIGTGDTLTITGAGIFDTGERPAGADWTAAGATLDITDATVLRGDSATVGQFDFVRLAEGAIFIHERNADRTYANNWELTGPGFSQITNRFSRRVSLTGIISGSGGLEIADFNSSFADNGNLLFGAFIDNNANSFGGGLVIDATNQPTVAIVAVDDRFGAVPTTFDPDNITLRNQGTLRLQGAININPNRGVTLDGGGTFLLNGNDNTLNSPITGTGPLQIGIVEANTRNTLHLDAPGSDYTGGTNILTGGISLGAANALPSDGVVTIGALNGTSRFDLNGFDQSIGGLRTTSNNTRETLTIDGTESTLTLNVADATNLSYAGNFIIDAASDDGDPSTTGFINIVKNGLGIQNLTRTTYGTGSLGSSLNNLTINEGLLSLNSNTPLGDVAINDGGTFRFNSNQSFQADSFTASSASSTIYNWNINDWTGAAGTGFASFNVTGDFTVPAGADFEILVTENSLVNFMEVDMNFVIGSVVGAVDAANATFTVDDSNFTSGAGTWSASIVGQDLILSYTASAMAGGEIIITDCSSGPGTISGTNFSISFMATDDVDVYASSDLEDFGATPIAEDVSGSPFVEEDVTDTKRFYILVPAGQPLP